MQRQHGLTLLELLVVLAIIGLAMAGVSFSLRDSSQTHIEREAHRLVAILEATRAQSRTSGVSLIWQASAEGFVVRPALSTPTHAFATRNETWLTAGMQAQVSTANNAATANWVVLGPEPIVPPVRITLSTATATLSIGTDGLQPFRVLP